MTTKKPPEPSFNDSTKKMYKIAVQISCGCDSPAGRKGYRLTWLKQEYNYRVMPVIEPAQARGYYFCQTASTLQGTQHRWSKTAEFVYHTSSNKTPVYILSWKYSRSLNSNPDSYPVAFRGTQRIVLCGSSTPHKSDWVRVRPKSVTKLLNSKLTRGLQ